MHMKICKNLYVFLLLAAIGLSLAACGGSKEAGSANSGDSSTASTQEADSDIQDLTIKISFSTATSTPKHYGSLAMQEYIEEASGGKIKVQIYPNSTLFGDKDEFENLIANNVQFIIPDMVRLTSNDPAFNISAMPFLFSSDEEALRFWDGPYGQEIFKRLEKDGALGVAVWPNGSKSITNNKRPIRSPEDFKGLSFRIPAGDIIEKTYATLGASAASIPFDELYIALQQGTVDGQENTFSNIDTRKLDEVQKYMTVTGHNRIDYLLLTNTKFWDSLNEPTKKIVEEGIKRGTEEARKRAKEINDEAFNNLKERGKIEIYELSEEEVKELRDALKPVYDEFGKIIGEEFIEAALNQ